MGQPAVSTRDRTRIAELTSELGVLRLSAPPTLAAVMSEVRELLEVESAVLYSLDRRATVGWELARWDVAGAIGANRTRALVEKLLASDDARPLFYDPLLPAPDIRDRVFEAVKWIDGGKAGAWKASRLYREVFAPMRMFDHQQLRALVCDGPVMLGWFGVIHPEATTARHAAVLTALLPAVRARLIVERRLASADRQAHVLEVALDQLGSAAFVISAGGAIHDSNALGRALLASHRGDVRTALLDALAHRPNEIGFELVAVTEPGAAPCWIAILRGAPRALRIAAAVDAVATAWQLTPRQREVLSLVTHGHANGTIAAQLRVSSRTVELHVSTLLARAGTENRAALVARILAG